MISIKHGYTRKNFDGSNIRFSRCASANRANRNLPFLGGQMWLRAVNTFFWHFLLLLDGLTANPRRYVFTINVWTISPSAIALRAALPRGFWFS
ncbi:hypothetical protein HBN83_02220 [Pseudomonas fragi]|uniref:hypothetical protein n=1 Tax=Pseudomonas fragi TaxID=296 RepID=UPI0014749640|nr:hypothetical protein [Pseudomonas fragi]NNB04713.1 hypothetical protein [Pseudomonas fragi]